MFAERLSPLIASFPEEAEPLRLMANYLVDFERRRGERVKKIRLDPSRMFEIMRAGSNSHLAILISILIEGGIFKRQLVVRFPSGAGLTFANILELPETVRDPVMDIDYQVDESNVEPSYILVLDDRS